MLKKIVANKKKHQADPERSEQSRVRAKTNFGPRNDVVQAMREEGLLKGRLPTRGSALDIQIKERVAARQRSPSPMDTDDSNEDSE